MKIVYKNTRVLGKKGVERVASVEGIDLTFAWHDFFPTEKSKKEFEKLAAIKLNQYVSNNPHTA